MPHKFWRARFGKKPNPKSPSTRLVIKEAKEPKLISVIKRIVEEYKRLCAQSSGRIASYDQPNNYLKRKIYRLGVLVIERDKLDIIKNYISAQLAEEHRNQSGLTSNADNAFTWMLRAVVVSAEKSVGDQDLISDQTRSKYALEMLYAHQHQVPSWILIGFLHQAGSYEMMAAKIKAGTREKWWKSIPPVSH